MRTRRRARERTNVHINAAFHGFLASAYTARDVVGFVMASAYYTCILSIIYCNCEAARVYVCVYVYIRWHLFYARTRSNIKCSRVLYQFLDVRIGRDIVKLVT